MPWAILETKGEWTDIVSVLKITTMQSAFVVLCLKEINHIPFYESKNKLNNNCLINATCLKQINKCYKRGIIITSYLEMDTIFK